MVTGFWEAIATMWRDSFFALGEGRAGPVTARVGVTVIQGNRSPVSAQLGHALPRFLLGAILHRELKLLAAELWELRYAPSTSLSPKLGRAFLINTVPTLAAPRAS